LIGCCGGTALAPASLRTAATSVRTRERLLGLGNLRQQRARPLGRVGQGKALPVQVGQDDGRLAPAKRILQRCQCGLGRQRRQPAPAELGRSLGRGSDADALPGAK
jgi:hypothetical protein